MTFGSCLSSWLLINIPTNVFQAQLLVHERLHPVGQHHPQHLCSHRHSGHPQHSHIQVSWSYFIFHFPSSFVRGDFDSIWDLCARFTFFVFITSRKLTEHYRNLQENIETTNVTSVSLHREVKCRPVISILWLCRDFAVTLPWLSGAGLLWSFVSRARHRERLTTGNRPHRNGKAWLIKQENRKLRVISNSFDKLEN